MEQHIIDIILAAVFILITAKYFFRGFAKTVLNFLAFFMSIVLAVSFSTQITDWIFSNTRLFMGTDRYIAKLIIIVLSFLVLSFLLDRLLFCAPVYSLLLFLRMMIPAPVRPVFCVYFGMFRILFRWLRGLLFSGRLLFIITSAGIRFFDTLIMMMSSSSPLYSIRGPLSVFSLISIIPRQVFVLFCFCPARFRKVLLPGFHDKFTVLFSIGFRYELLLRIKS